MSDGLKMHFGLIRMVWSDAAQPTCSHAWSQAAPSTERYPSLEERPETCALDDELLDVIGMLCNLLHVCPMQDVIGHAHLRKLHIPNN